ncbi:MULTISPECIES: efflux RND transporter periplasmic adaptor subunit [unclassified Bradyrhizobium]|uniref:efflux RND transporter periplasmic adaptor subunit n=1 Tax=unclassified Bradyrhizobium TaxID=2631580 RepID=UPI001BA7C541|nr:MULTISPECIES: efflux RND transporter periplasmic adaptor subunit [unclassified Bradyrhizobium]MBR1208121.1 efflux RND transporter periplasmic adaptor subunit [Bradyrhizobium sp. AUGA SZCCT0124]MBR1316470.1 efflux RND transporter periplasmic adaptor subunit [Bradyrhizobium sp. AUGA SZCCT0051]MBR1344635.1 efflux RND transporter periplasmic adaptor subunit [Bradyrhizobium sp. AUGA SZCCT0105]MBR1359491.1 efflux RND transporter periplasmic adaptor subunit [Bradyrhizobium sp. AUGA SZCCT0045]
MNRPIGVLLITSAIMVAGVFGLAVGRSNAPLPEWLDGVLPAAAKQSPRQGEAPGPILYYRDPDGLPAYSLTPKKTSAGKDYLAVRSSEDLSFEAKAPETMTAKGGDRGKIRYYRNPMGLPDTSPTPKKDSMGMAYLPVYEGEQDDDSSVKVSAGKLQKAGVQTELAERRTLNTMVRAPGIVEEDERRKSVVSLRFEGFIDTVGNVTTGTHVYKGQPLMRIYGPNLSSAAAEYLSALNARPDAGIGNQALKGARRRLENLGAPDSFIADIEHTREIPVYMNWPAPQDGEIVERTAVNGMRAAPGDVLFRIVDHDVVWVMVDVAERDLGLIEVGQKVTVRPRAYPDRPFIGKVSLIYPHLKAETRTARIRIELSNPDDVLRPDMYADVEIATGTEAPVVTVSSSAVIDSGERQVVLLDKGDGRFEPREVKLGRRGGGRVEIREGLTENDKVVVSANFLIDAESNLKAALKGLDAGEKSQ